MFTHLVLLRTVRDAKAFAEGVKFVSAFNAIPVTASELIPEHVARLGRVADNWPDDAGVVVIEDQTQDGANDWRDEYDAG